uniref:Protein transport protein SEC13 n=1 Tax=Cyclophora tenuis TaxID=216820 RepID=A0A7S1GJP6_CYCTE|mmetsp:Transcript_13518/g.23002  ORF Transcript_13518/g.23002 Transcript_13518/m.23002 type:complete len:298 (+) Transcript_13518:1-894(+)
MVHDAQFDYYGCKLATSSSDKTIRIYNVSGSSYEHTATLQGHDGPVWQVSWAHPKFGVILASCSFDGSVLIHRETRPQEWMELHAARNLHESSVNGIAFAPHEFGLMVATASSDGKISILTHQPDNSWPSESISDNLLGVNAVSWAPYGAYYDESNPDNLEPPRLVSGGCDNRIRIWVKSSTGAWQEDAAAIDSSLSHSDWVRDVAWAPPILPNVNTIASCSEDGTVLIWTQEGRDEDWNPVLLNSFESPVWKVSWSVTGHMLAVSSGDSDVSLWKAGLDGSWSKMSTVDDNAASGN